MTTSSIHIRGLAKVFGDGATAVRAVDRIDLNLSAGTVRNYLSAAAAKTGARSSFEAAVTARDRGWL